VVYKFAKVTQVASVYEFDGFFLIELNFFIVYFFLYSFKK